MYRHYTYKFGISIPTSSKIGPGLFITHFGGIVINKDSIIGKNCNISSGVFLDEINAGVNKGVPIIGDNVCIGPGVKIAGNVMVGNNVVIGANCVVTKDIEDNSKVLSGHNNTIEDMDVDGYIGFTDYKNKIVG
jgi:serine O-acetyltransferase